MPIYDAEALQQLETAHKKVHDKYAALLDAFLARNYANRLAQEMATHGVCRRLRILVHCINKVFASMPPASDRIPAGDDRSECEVSVQAFILNVFGCLDNLANLWVKERGIKRSNGKDIAPLLIGLGDKCTDVRRSLSEEFQQYLASEQMETWFKCMEGFRHALAHRVPLSSLSKPLLTYSSAFQSFRTASGFSRSRRVKTTSNASLAVSTNSLRSVSPRGRAVI